MRIGREIQSRRRVDPNAVTLSDQFVEELAHVLRSAAAATAGGATRAPTSAIGLVARLDALKERDPPLPASLREPVRSRDPNWLIERLRAAQLWLAMTLAIPAMVALFFAGALPAFDVLLAPENGADAARVAAVDTLPGSAPSAEGPLVQLVKTVQRPFAGGNANAPGDAKSAAVREAEALIMRGDVASARTLLSRAAADGDPAAILALAETFDPNMLAAWGARVQAADASTARMLYGQALAAGIERARTRLDALQ